MKKFICSVIAIVSLACVSLNTFGMKVETQESVNQMLKKYKKSGWSNTFKSFFQGVKDYAPWALLNTGISAAHYALSKKLPNWPGTRFAASTVMQLAGIFGTYKLTSDDNFVRGELAQVFLLPAAFGAASRNGGRGYALSYGASATSAATIATTAFALYKISSFFSCGSNVEFD